MKRKRKSTPLPPWTPFEGPFAPPASEPGASVWRNSRYQVIVRCIGVGDPLQGTGSTRGWWLSIKSNDQAARHDWRDFQRIKNELVGPEAEGVELYPAESRLVDGSNQYHLWVFEGYRFPFGFADRVVVNASVGGAVQRPFPPGEVPADVRDPARVAADMARVQGKPLAGMVVDRFHESSSS